MKIIYKLLVLSIIFSIKSFGFETKKFAFEKQKNINKVFSTTDNVQTNITNSYGNINVYLWDENKVSIQVNIKVSGNNEAKITDRLDAIDVSFEASSNRVSAATEINSKNWKGNNTISYEINYIIKIPRNGNVVLDNKYGAISIEKLNGSSTINCQYGSLNLGEFNNKTNNFNISYSKNSTIEFIDKLNLKSQYSEFEIQKVNQISISGNYNDFTFNNVGSLDLNSNYTKIKSNSFQKVAIDGNYLTLRLGEIANLATINSNYTDLQLETTSKTNSITIEGNYGNSKLFCTSAFDFDINLSYGNLKDNLNLKYIEKSEKNNSKNYSGYFLSQGKSTIKISSNYGNVQLLNK